MSLEEVLDAKGSQVEFHDLVASRCSEAFEDGLVGYRFEVSRPDGAAAHDAHLFVLEAPVDDGGLRCAGILRAEFQRTGEEVIAFS